MKWGDENKREKRERTFCVSFDKTLKKIDCIDLSIPNDDRTREREREIYNPNISMI